jgi:hypothetical protein
MSSTETLPATPPSKKRKLEVAGDDEQVTRVTIVNLCRYDCNFSPWRSIFFDFTAENSVLPARVCFTIVLLQFLFVV